MAHLFVYGSLMSSARHAMGERLRRQARLLGEGSVAGRLYRVTWYPGLVDAGAPGQRVYGEVYGLDNAKATLQWLDAYEGIVAGNPDQNEYERVERPVRLASGEEILAWVYLYRKDVAKLSPVPDGRWVAGPG